MWDSFSGTQKFEFNSPEDQPLCGCYHPIEHVIACGFKSGVVRIFDVQTTSTLFERSMVASINQTNPPSIVGSPSSPVECICYSPVSKVVESEGSSSNWVKGLRLFALSVDGRLTVFDVDSGYQAIRSTVLSLAPDRVIADKSEVTARSMFMSIGANGALVAVASSAALSSFTVLDASDFSVVFKVSDTIETKKQFGNHISGTSSGSVKYSVSYPTSSPYYHNKVADNDSSPEELTEHSGRKGGVQCNTFTNTFTTQTTPESVFHPGGKSDRPVIGLEFVSDPCELGEYIALFTTKHMIVIGLGETSSLSSCVSTQRAAKLASIPTILHAEKPVAGQMGIYQEDISVPSGQELDVSGIDSSIQVTALTGLFKAAWDNRTTKLLLGHHQHSTQPAVRAKAFSSRATSASSLRQDVTPKLGVFDSHRGLLYLSTISSNHSTFSGTGSGESSISSSQQCSLRVLGVTLKRAAEVTGFGNATPSFRITAVLSPCQNYSSPTGSSSSPPLCITICGASGKVITASSGGILGIWATQSDESITALRMLQHVPSPVWPFGKSEGNYDFAEQKPTAMTEVFEAELVGDDLQNVPYESSVNEEQNDIVTALSVATDLMSPVGASSSGAAKHSKSPTPISKRTKSWAPSPGATSNNKNQAPKGFGKSKSASFQSPGRSDLSSPGIKSPSFYRSSSTASKKGANPTQKSVRPLSKKKSQDMDSISESKLEISTLDSARTDVFDEEPLSPSSVDENPRMGRALSHVRTDEDTTESKPLRIELTDLGKNIQEAIKSPMQNEKEIAVVLVSPIESTKNYPLSTSVAKTSPKSLDVIPTNISEGNTNDSKIGSSASPSITVLDLGREAAPEGEDVVSKMESSLFFDEFKGGKYIASEKSPSAMISRDDFLNLNSSESAGRSDNPADMLSVPPGSSELRSRTLSQKYCGKVSYIC